jgi:hypothetical protein
VQIHECEGGSTVSSSSSQIRKQSAVVYHSSTHSNPSPSKDTAVCCQQLFVHRLLNFWQTAAVALLSAYSFDTGTGGQRRHFLFDFWARSSSEKTFMHAQGWSAVYHSSSSGMGIVSVLYLYSLILYVNSLGDSNHGCVMEGQCTVIVLTSQTSS